ncbi:nitrate ABC transporter substrate-binding protein [Tissierella creatinini]|nr:nitrate ABC transporter substrate-binding protein [Tissierella creatinini]TJX63749.1 nitrate ABC transporter substrate-binding protein [Soehngenia saccharolytica]
MVEAQSRMQTHSIMAFMFIAALIGFAIDRVMLLVEGLLLRWKAD